ncbi:hypothetical protein [Nocardioides acrostichi]|uniref:Ig-like domain-containing protein n=1 Tax=Nocardioides acrostichi TaxID=2784339 RepID=A0A930Y5K9_9ACTN|nr:hypothetical protein [Nocardioides acrostichi]MBF4161345.1 hypothetical protein [Nocardioides acrostichi]
MPRPALFAAAVLIVTLLVPTAASADAEPSCRILARTALDGVVRSTDWEVPAGAGSVEGCTTLDVASGSEVEFVASYDSRVGWARVVDDNGEQQCRFSADQAGAVCPLTGRAPFRLWTTTRSDETWALGLVRLDDSSSCPELEPAAYFTAGGTSAAVDGSGDDFAMCWTVDPAGLGSVTVLSAAPAGGGQGVASVTPPHHTTAACRQFYDSDGDVFQREQHTVCRPGATADPDDPDDRAAVVVVPDQGSPRWSVAVRPVADGSSCQTGTENGAAATGTIGSPLELDCYRFEPGTPVAAHEGFVFGGRVTDQQPAVGQGLRVGWSWVTSTGWRAWCEEDDCQPPTDVPVVAVVMGGDVGSQDYGVALHEVQGVDAAAPRCVSPDLTQGPVTVQVVLDHEHPIACMAAVLGTQPAQDLRLDAPDGAVVPVAWADTPHGGLRPCLVSADDGPTRLTCRGDDLVREGAGTGVISETGTVVLRRPPGVESLTIDLRLSCSDDEPCGDRTRSRTSRSRYRPTTRWSTVGSTPRR